MGDAIAADLASRLILKLVSLATEQVIQAWKVHEDLETLRDTLESIDALLSDAATKKLTMSTVQNWFNKLQAVAHVADAFMDELSYEITRQKVENHHHKLRNFFSPSKNSILYRFKVAHKIKSIHTSFDKILDWAQRLGLQPIAHLSSLVQPSEIRNTPPFEDESLIVGREKDISYLVAKVCGNNQEVLPVIAVIGMGGQGKTTLARMVYNSKDVLNEFEDRRMWVTVSDDFNFVKILNQMVESLTSTTSVLTNAQGLVNALQEKLKGKKFFLVLDDVWNENPDEWDNLRNSLLGISGAKGSNIVVTTRTKEVIDAMQHSVDSYPVEKLSEENSWTLFKQRAFSHGGVLETEEFVALGRRMVERCGGLPLAIKTLGGLLHSKKSEQEWLQIQNSDIWKSKGVLSCLRLSYDNLPNSSLKRCFTYCSSMPKDYVIKKDQLVQIWMALGFLIPARGRNVALMEDIGNDYFNILLWNCLLQDIERDEYGNITSCKMHDLVHDLALDLSKHHSVTVKAGHELNHVSEAIYLRLDEGVSYIKPTIPNRNLEIVQMLYAGSRIIGNVLPYLKHVTVLVLVKETDIELPTSLGDMKYLKYLDISNFYSDRLPDYITKLYNLQTLRVGFVEEIPKTICNLINLRHFYFSHLFPESCVFIGIDRLTCLQTLPHFVVSRDQNCLVGQLGGLDNLRGKLHIYGLGDVANKEEASMAKLCRKSNIEELWLCWSSDEDVREDIEYNDEDVMEGLRPHANLKNLWIDNFKGNKFASWITMMTNLVKITLMTCNLREGFPQLGHFPKLREMNIHGVKVMGSGTYGGLGSGSSELSDSGAAKTVTALYPSLRVLELSFLSKLEEWVETVILMNTDGDEQSIVPVCPKLEVLRISSCSKLTRSSMPLETMSRMFSSLTCLGLFNISDEGEGSSSLSNMTSIIEEFLKNNYLSLKELLLDSSCSGLTCLTLGVALMRLVVINCPDLTTINVVEESVGLKYLWIASCPSLSEWVFAQSVSSTLLKLELGPLSEELDEFPWPFSSSSSVISFPNLGTLILNGWEKVNSILPAVGKFDDDCLSSTFPALMNLEIFSFEGVKYLPDSLASLPSLRRLDIEFCNNLGSLPKFDKSHSIQSLTISCCSVLKERCRKGSGPEWFKIQHIPYIEWDGYRWW